jgi:formylglycine-generating enzyme required for sulfatase activity
MINKRTQTVFFLFIILTLALSACLRPDVAAPPEVPAAPPVPPAVPAAPVPPPTPSLTATPASPELPFYQFVPGGQFTMGSKKGDPLAKEDEFPKHDVRLPGYWIFTNEVTNELYAECVAAGKCTPPATAETGPKSHYNDPAFKNFPVVGVVWNQADTFCKAQDAHLPTEAEWEKAARGFFGNTYPWGAAEADCKLANINGCVKDTAKVASYTDGKSPFEVRDMAGNVREWVSDWYQADAYQTAILFMPNGPETGKMKVVRGGSYLDSARDSRSSARFAYDPEREFDDVGFRCVPNTQTYSPFCSTTYRSPCRPPRPGNPPDNCDPGTLTSESAKTGVTISCPNANGFGTVHVTTSEPVANINVGINGNGVACSSGPNTSFECQGMMPAVGSPVTIEVCLVSGITSFNPDFGLHLTSCESFNLVASIGDTITVNETDDNPYFLAGLALIPGKMPLNGGGCFEGTTWDPKSQQCVKDKPTPIQPTPGTEGMCPDGYVMDPNLLCCVPGTEDNSGCEKGYYHSVAADLCIPIEQNGCPAGWVYDPYQGCMQPVHQGEEPKGCPPGTHLLPDGKTCAPDQQGDMGDITCPPGSLYVPGQGCVTSDIGTPPVQCKDGYYYDYNLQICVALTQDGCPAGTYLDPNLKQCLPLTGPWTGCPKNYMINPRTGCCVPVPGTDNTDCLGYPDGQENGPVLVGGGPGWDPGSSDCPPPVEIVCPPDSHPSPDGTYCISNVQCPFGTSSTPNNPYGCFPQGTEPCPDGYEMSNSGMGCVPIVMDGVQWQCTQSQYFDPYLGMCLDRTDDCCAQGYYFDPQFKQCLPYPVEQNCPSGYVFVVNECIPFVPMGAGCTSFNLTVPSCAESCPPGTHWDKDQKRCVTPCSNFNCSYYKSGNCPKCCKDGPVGTGVCVPK